MRQENNTRIPKEIQKRVAPMPMGLSGTAIFWKTVIHTYIELEIIPHLYTHYQHNPHRETQPKEIVATNGTSVIYATIHRDCIILTEALTPSKSLSKERALSYGYEWYRTTLSLWIDKHYHFLKTYQSEKFNLALIVPAYHNAKALMPNDRLVINDGNSSVVIAKKDGSTLVLITGENFKISTPEIFKE